MHGLTTMHILNQRNAEAERIMREYAQQDGRGAPTQEPPTKRDDLADIGQE